jgi:hypothetical protein
MDELPNVDIDVLNKPPKHKNTGLKFIRIQNTVFDEAIENINRNLTSNNEDNNVREVTENLSYIEPRIKTLSTHTLHIDYYSANNVYSEGYKIYYILKEPIYYVSSISLKQITIGNYFDRLRTDICQLQFDINECDPNGVFVRPLIQAAIINIDKAYFNHSMRKVLKSISTVLYSNPFIAANFKEFSFRQDDFGHLTLHAATAVKYYSIKMSILNLNRLKELQSAFGFNTLDFTFYSSEVKNKINTTTLSMNSFFMRCVYVCSNSLMYNTEGKLEYNMNTPTTCNILSTINLTSPYGNTIVQTFSNNYNIASRRDNTFKIDAIDLFILDDELNLMKLNTNEILFSAEFLITIEV